MTVDTSFLPDDGKDDRDMELRNQLRVEWLNQQTKLKNQELFNRLVGFFSDHIYCLWAIVYWYMACKTE